MQASETLCLVYIDAYILHALRTPICISADIASLSCRDAKPWRRRFFPIFPSMDGGDLISQVSSSHPTDLGIQMIYNPTVKDLFHNQIHMVSQTHTHSIWAVQNGYTNVLSSQPSIFQAADNRAPLATS